MRWLVAALAMIMALVAGPAYAEKRVALIIGNSAYQNVPRLDNPSRDASAITKLFQDAKFDLVESRRDLGFVETRRVLRDFYDKARDADIAVLYFAGHGIEVEGSNYLIPVDAVLERDRDAQDEAIALDRLLQTVEPAKQLRLVILDACRDNPFARRMNRTYASTRSIGRGLAAVEPTKPNTLIAFAAKSGSTAQDGGSGNNSPYTTALLKHLTTPGLDLRRAFGIIRDEVMSDTGDRQEPFLSASLGGKDVSLVPPLPAPKPVAQPAPIDTQADMRRDYEFTQQLGTKEGWTFFLQQYPTGFYANLARGQLSKIDAEEQRQVAAEKARATEAERARLASENARAEEQARAAREAKAAEAARIAAEQLKAAEQARTDAAERQRQAMERAAAEKLARETKAAEDARLAAEKKAAEQTKIDEAKRAADAATADRLARVKADEDAKRARGLQVAEDARLAAEKKAADDTRIAAEKKAAEQAKADEARTKIAALQSQTATPEPTLSVSRQLQTELRRVGCFSATIGDEWSPDAKRAVEDFAKREKMTLDSAVASTTALDIVRAKVGKVCALACGPREEERGGQCVRKTCAKGKVLDEDGDCVAKEVPKRAPKVAAPPKPVREKVVARPKPVAEVAPRAPRAAPSGGGGGGGRCFAFSGRSYCE